MTDAKNNKNNFINKIIEALIKIMFDKAMRNDESSYILRISNNEIREGLKRTRIHPAIIDDVCLQFTNAGYSVVKEEDSIKIEAVGIFAKKEFYTFTDLEAQNKVILARNKGKESC